ncbi:TVP38/TMEM64 family protein [Shewanella sp. GXUN23E]|uniref:TVP38/TMEM64 family protein n=1 Tax=Shewanella sp. GXUN23E TaxID=3422498 RepID=UPI003D7D04A6
MNRWLKALVLAGLLLLLMWVVNAGWLENLSDSNWVARFLAQGGVQAWLSLFAAGAVFTALGGPRQMLAFVSGFSMGGAIGATFATLATLIGALMCFALARTLLRARLKRRFAHRLIKVEKLLSHDAWLKVMMIRLMPVGSNLLTNLLLGTTHVGALSFSIGSVLGYLPQMLIFAFAGAGLGMADEWQLAISLSLLVISACLAFYLYHSRVRREVEEIA